MPIPYFPANYGVNPYMPQMYQNQYIPPQAQPVQTVQGNILAAWVQGEGAMKSFTLGAGQTAFLFDTEGNSFGVKTVDASGMPLPLRLFDYKERDAAKTQQETPAAASVDVSGFVTREEFESRIAQIITAAAAKSAPQPAQMQHQSAGAAPAEPFMIGGGADGK